MNALVLKDYGVLDYIPVENPQLGRDDVLIRIAACGICGSDVHGYVGTTGRRIPTIIMGHEASGQIVSLGSDVTQWHVGDRVTFDSNIYCNACQYCLSGQRNLCINNRVVGVSCPEYRQQGAMAEFIVLPQRSLYKIPDVLSYEQACLVEPMAIAFHGVGLTPIKINDVAAVVGAGTIGLLAIQALRLAGCGNIIAIDIDDKKLKIAQSYGADYAILAQDKNVITEIKKISGKDGADIVVDAVGINTSIETALLALKRRGHLTVIGNLVPHINFPLQQIVAKEITMQGSWTSNGEYQACLDMIARKAVEIDFLISGVEPLKDGGKWFSKLYEGESDLLKIILRP